MIDIRVEREAIHLLIGGDVVENAIMKGRDKRDPDLIIDLTTFALDNISLS